MYVAEIFYFAARAKHGEVIRHLAVPHELVSFIVGHDGYRVNKIAEQTNTYILSPKVSGTFLVYI